MALSDERVEGGEKKKKMERAANASEVRYIMRGLWLSIRASVETVVYEMKKKCKRRLENGREGERTRDR